MTDILLRASITFDVPIKAILGTRRTQCVVEARQAVAYAARRKTVLSLQEIGIRLGGRDHTTIIYAIRAAEQRAAADYDYAMQLAELL